jgi:hypothetical protein
MAQLRKMVCKLYKLYNEPDIVKVIKLGLGHLFRMQEQNPCRKLTLHKSEDTWRVGSPAVTWLDSVEEYFKTMAFRYCNRLLPIDTVYADIVTCYSD